ncbi:MAG: peptidylprolyl isomerase [Gaiellaceae bacterium]
MRRLAFVVAPFLCVILLVGGCGGGSDSSTHAPRGPEKLKPPSAPLDPAKRWTLTFATDRGTFVIVLAPKTSPHAAASFVALARRGYFDNTIFHRIVPGFVIQGGDPTQSGSGGPGYTTIDPPASNTRYLKGVVAMAKTASEPRGAAGSQFFVMTADAASLPPDYAVVGRVTSGMSVVEKIGELGDASDPNGTPTETVIVEHVTVTTR